MIRASSLIIVFVLVAAFTAAADDQALRTRSEKAYNAGNYKEAYEGFKKLALDKSTNPEIVANDLGRAVDSLSQLGQFENYDSLLAEAVAVHPENPRVLAEAARRYTGANHYGYIVAGTFTRGYPRGGDGRHVTSMERDRVRALQLLVQAIAASRDERETAGLWMQFADAVSRDRQAGQAWKLQILTDLTKLPDYDEPQYGYSYLAAPSDAAGNPVFFHVPASYEASENDGERFRWAIAQYVEAAPDLEDYGAYLLASFWRDLWDVQTLANWRFGADDTREGTYSVHTLEDTETIAKLAGGVKRFSLPDEFNYIKTFQRLQGNKRRSSTYAETASDALITIYENRRQYPKAAYHLRQTIERFGRGYNNSRQHKLDQIAGAWGEFEPSAVRAAGEKTLEFRFRNATSVTFEAYEIDIEKVLADLRSYLKSNPAQLDGSKLDVENIGARIVINNENQYRRAKVASWSEQLTPRPNHFDTRATLNTPLQAPGAYLIEARVAGGNMSRIVLWIADTAIVKKPIEKGALYFVADAASGKPVADASLEFFGFKQVSREQHLVNRITGRWYDIETTQFNAATDANGIAAPEAQSQDYRWFVTARQGERLAFLGFSSVWRSQAYDAEYNQIKTFVITDRPVYRPDQTVKFKVWVAQAKYDAPDTSPFAHRAFNVLIRNPRGETAKELKLETDVFGGMQAEFQLPKDAQLGVYSVQVSDQNHLGAGSFRVEEYKKPEFEVTVEAPSEPVMLGDAIKAKVQAKYYFGSPVTNAKAKYKVLRSSREVSWYPPAIWDWLFGPGYWWFAYDYAWFPGWSRWACKRPWPWFWHRPSPPPELVLENELPINEDGTLSIEIDTKAAKEIHGDTDHYYDITVEVTDQSRRTIVGTGQVIAARQPFRVYAWVDRGHYTTGDTVKAQFRALTADRKPVQGKGSLKLLSVSYPNGKDPEESTIETWELNTNADGEASQQLKAARPGQYRLSYTVNDSAGHNIEGGYVFTIIGTGFDGQGFRFNDLELIPDRAEYAPGDKVRLLINTNTENATVLLFVKPANGVYLPPEIIELRGKSTTREIAVTKKDMPNFFVEALTVSGGKAHTEVKEIVVPPERKVLNVDVTPSAMNYKPGSDAQVELKITDVNGKPFAGSLVLAVYDKAVEYISGGSNVPDIRKFFWEWRRHHRSTQETNLDNFSYALHPSGEITMQPIGVLGASVADDEEADKQLPRKTKGGFGRGNEFARRKAEMRTASLDGPMEAKDAMLVAEEPAAAPAPASLASAIEGAAGMTGESAALQAPAIRKEFADTAYWKADISSDEHGRAQVKFRMPENLTQWKFKAWAMGQGTQVGEGDASAVTAKNLLIRLQAPRFFVEKDEVVLSANIHNYLPKKKRVTARLELEGGTIQLLEPAEKAIDVASSADVRVDWKVRVKQEGEAVVRMSALSDEESDAMEMRFPVYVHGMLKTESFSGVLAPDVNSGALTFKVPAERRPEQTKFELRYSPSLAGAMVDALPYLIDFPYGCTEQTLNRFLPSVITQKVLRDLGLNLRQIKEKRANLNAQERGSAQERARQWKRYAEDPVFDEDKLASIVRAGLERLEAMQLSDGGWGWFSGYGEHSTPHMTATVLHGLQVAVQNGLNVESSILQRGAQWLRNYEAAETKKLENAPGKTEPYKTQADDIDSLVHMVLTDAGMADTRMREFLYRDRNHLSLYAKAMLGVALAKQKDQEKLSMVMRNLSQYVVEDNENQTAYLRFPNDNAWWYWHGSESETHAYYLKLLSMLEPKGQLAPKLVKYLLNNRKHATYWNSTRDTALIVEAFADYLRASGEQRPDLNLEILLDGKTVKQVRIGPEDLFSFDNLLLIEGPSLSPGEHKVEIRKKGSSPLYYNAYLENFTLEDFITKAGLEIKVERKYYKLDRVEARDLVSGSHGQAVSQIVEKYIRRGIANQASLKSGDLVEVELEIDSKNDYEYLIFEDLKPAGLEPVEVRSGYNGNDLNAYVEFRDERVAFFAQRLARGKHSVSYRMRAEIPGKFSALPAKGSAMYAPELKANSDEFKIGVHD